VPSRSPNLVLYQARWRAANPARVVEYERRRRERDKADPERNARRRAKQDVWAVENADKLRASRKKSREAHIELRRGKERAQHERRPSRCHGLTPVELRVVLERQGGVCAICKTDKPGRRGWQGDHDHKTGQFRAVLCNRCNMGAGMFRDDPAALRAAAAYLDRHASL